MFSKKLFPDFVATSFAVLSLGSPVSTVSIQISAETVGFRPKKTPHRRNRRRIPAQRGRPESW
eukprot:COSAG06_NODE_685_length_13103_cov_126.328668_2_plen_63_part_00